MNPRHSLQTAAAVLVSTLVALVVAVSPAAASSAVGQAYIDESVELGLAFWAERNVTPCPSPTITVVADPAGVSGAAGAAWLESCSIELDHWLVREAARERIRLGYGGDSQRLELCTTIVHELGHLGGLEHTESGIMAGAMLTNLARSSSVAPGSCRSWVRGLERLERRAAKARAAARKAQRRAIARAHH